MNNQSEPEDRRFIINGDQADALLNDMTEEERWAIVSRYEAETSVSRLADMLDVAPKHIRKLLISASGIFICNIMNTRLLLAKSHLPETSVNSALMNALFAGMDDTQIQVVLSRFYADLSVQGIADQLQMERKDVSRNIVEGMRILMKNCLATIEVQKLDDTEEQPPKDD